MHRTISSKIGLVKLKMKIKESSDLAKNIIELHDFASKFGVILAKNLNEFRSGLIRPNKLIIIILCLISMLLCAIRFTSTALFPNKWLLVLMSNCNYLAIKSHNLADSDDNVVRLTTLSLSMAAWVMFSIRAFFLNQELNGKFEIIGFIVKMLDKQLLGLNEKHQARLEFNVWIVCKVCSETRVIRTPFRNHIGL